MPATVFPVHGGPCINERLLLPRKTATTSEHVMMLASYACEHTASDWVLICDDQQRQPYSIHNCNSHQTGYTDYLD
jgi:hypothetical protein